jgi:hypothetical protein
MLASAYAISISGWSHCSRYIATNSSGFSGDALSKRRLRAPVDLQDGGALGDVADDVAGVRVDAGLLARAEADGPDVHLGGPPIREGGGQQRPPLDRPGRPHDIPLDWARGRRDSRSPTTL